MGTRVDFLNWLDQDMSLKIFMCLEDPSDLVRVSCVSRSWRRFVIANGLCKQLCLKLFPHLRGVAGVIEPNLVESLPLEAGCSKSVEWNNLERVNRDYAFLAKACLSFASRMLISEAIIASSTDNDPEESVQNTLQPREIVAGRPSYWSSQGQRDPTVPETLVYKLASDICVIYEIGIQPFQAFFQVGAPIYSAKSVRFRMGHLKLPIADPMVECSDKPGEENFVWTYTSPIFQMSQENRLQKFKLTEPVLCIGGILQVELLGRVQRQAIDGLFYICICHVQAMGQSLPLAFDVEILKSSGQKVQSYSQTILPED